MKNENMLYCGCCVRNIYATTGNENTTLRMSYHRLLCRTMLNKICQSADIVLEIIMLHNIKQKYTKMRDVVLEINVPHYIK